MPGRREVLTEWETLGVREKGPQAEPVERGEEPGPDRRFAHEAGNSEKDVRYSAYDFGIS